MTNKLLPKFFKYLKFLLIGLIVFIAFTFFIFNILNLKIGIDAQKEPCIGRFFIYKETPLTYEDLSNLVKEHNYQFLAFKKQENMNSNFFALKLLDDVVVYKKNQILIKRIIATSKDWVGVFKEGVRVCPKNLDLNNQIPTKTKKNQTMRNLVSITNNEIIDGLDKHLQNLNINLTPNIHQNLNQNINLPLSQNNLSFNDPLFQECLFYKIKENDLLKGKLPKFYFLKNDEIFIIGASHLSLDSRILGPINKNKVKVYEVIF